jgi:hypothetical protein
MCDSLSFFGTEYNTMNITPMPDERLDQINEHLFLLQKKKILMKKDLLKKKLKKENMSKLV